MQKVGLQIQQWCLKRQVPVEYFQTVDSTSSFAKTIMMDPLENHHSLHVVVSESQEAGRGRGLNSWLNPAPGTSLLSTWSFRLTRPPQPITSIRVGLALYHAVTHAWPEAPFSLKAPNDLYLGDKKVAGLLLEAVEQGPHIRLLIGLGLNVFSSPNLESGTELLKHISPEQIEANWDHFLDELYRGFQTASDQVSQHLSAMDIQRLMMALNAYPALTSPYTKIEATGDLWQGSHKTNWFDL